MLSNQQIIRQSIELVLSSRDFQTNWTMSGTNSSRSRVRKIRLVLTAIRSKSRVTKMLVWVNKSISDHKKKNLKGKSLLFTIFKNI